MRDLPKNVYRNPKGYKKPYRVSMSLNGKFQSMGHFDKVEDAEKFAVQKRKEIPKTVGGQYNKGNKPWNKDVKGIHLNPETEFKACKPSEHKSWKGGVQTPKKDCVYLNDPEKSHVRVRRPRAIWESKHGPIPHNHVIIHLDGDRYNDDIDNLDCISRAENLKRNRKK
tara:strand:- start:1225 stop:1728 length:504 start_codon:yes stop_codon:yes gene_type:complete